MKILLQNFFNKINLLIKSDGSNSDSSDSESSDISDVSNSDTSDSSSGAVVIITYLKIGTA